ncbi:MAG: MGH1-like glycoside hydrolase domain-containing protein [Planctomycetota bacterium]
MQYQSDDLQLLDDCVVDRFGPIRLDDLPDPQPICPARLGPATPMMQRLWKIALADIESNIATAEDGRQYFGAGTTFGPTVFTRDISYAGLLGLNRLYPELMRSSLEYSRQVRRRIGLKIAAGYESDDWPGQGWTPTGLPHRQFKLANGSNGYLRRTDDVVWIACAGDLLGLEAGQEDYRWMYETGCEFFQRFYDRFLDETSGLYRGQASFVDVHFPAHKATGYPQEFSIADCVLVRATSTNCLYVWGMAMLSRAARELGLKQAAAEWSARAEKLRQAMHALLRREDGTFEYFLDRHGNPAGRRDALGSALAVLAGVVLGVDAMEVVGDYPISDIGAPLFEPFYSRDDFYHNNTSWPYVDTLLLWARQRATGRDDELPRNAALLARTVRDGGTFHEVVDYRTGQVRGSGSQLWSAAGFVNVCLRAGLVEGQARLI